MKRISLVIAVLTVVTSFLSCASCLRNNRPPLADQPWPEPHDGVFVCGNDTMVFNGDGNSVSWHFAEGMDAVDLQGKGTFVFLFDHKNWRYDAAERFSISRDGDNAEQVFGMGVPGSTTATEIHLLRFDLDDSREEIFEKVQ